MKIPDLKANLPATEELALSRLENKNNLRLGKGLMK